jgi:hypothetical protein
MQINGALLQVLIIQNKATAFPVQEFDTVAIAVNEDKHLTRYWVAIKLALHQHAPTPSKLLRISVSPAQR